MSSYSLRDILRQSLEKRICRHRLMEYISSEGKSNRTERQKEQREKYRYDFSPSGIDLKSFPYAVWRNFPAKSFWMIVQRPFALEIRRVSMGCAVRSAVICIRREESGARRTDHCRGGNDYLLMPHEQYSEKTRKSPLRLPDI